jgi:hypothetical protein
MMKYEAVSVLYGKAQAFPVLYRVSVDRIDGSDMPGRNSAAGIPVTI